MRSWTGMTVEETPTAEPLAAPWGSTGRDRSTEPGVADDFKGQFKTHNGVYCYPLTVTDHYSRSLLLCHGLPSVKGDGVKPLLEKLFRELGLPEVIRTDNGLRLPQPAFTACAL